MGGGKKFRDSSAVFPSNVERGNQQWLGGGKAEEKKLQNRQEM